jgi:hypothetical protein
MTLFKCLANRFGRHPCLDRLEALVQLQLKVITMSESLDQRLADLIALAQKDSDDAAKFRADVTAALAKLGTVAPMTPEQQAAFDNVTAILTASDTATVEADAALSPVPAA